MKKFEILIGRCCHSYSIPDENYIIEAINKLKNGKASGPDKVSSTIVKYVKDLIAKPLKLIFNDSLTSVVFPDL